MNINEKTAANLKALYVSGENHPPVFCLSLGTASRSVDLDSVNVHLAPTGLTAFRENETSVIVVHESAYTSGYYLHALHYFAETVPSLCDALKERGALS